MPKTGRTNRRKTSLPKLIEKYYTDLADLARQNVLFQHGQRILTADMHDPAKLAELVTEFFRYVEPEIEEFEEAVAEFKERVPDLAEGLAKKIADAHRTNPAFKKAFADFFELCQT